MLVGDVRSATTGSGVSWKLSGASHDVSAVTKRSKNAPVQQRVPERLPPARRAAAGGRDARRGRRAPGPPTARPATARRAAPPRGRAATRAAPAPVRVVARHATAARIAPASATAGPHAAPDHPGRVGHAALDLGGRPPLEQVPVRDRHAPERAHDRVRRDERLVRQERRWPGRAGGRWWPRRGPPRRSRRATTCRAADGAPPAGATPATAPRARRGPAASSGAASTGSSVQPATRKASCAISDRAAPQVVDDLPAREERQPVPLAAARARHRGGEPGQELPVAPDPAVLAAGEGEVARRVVVVHDHVGGEARRARSSPRSGRATAACSRGSGRAWRARTPRRRRRPCR